MSDNKAEINTWRDNIRNLDVFKSRVLVDGNYLPTTMELIEIMKDLDLKPVFKDVGLSSKDNGHLRLRFGSLGQTRLFLAAIEAEGVVRELFWNSLSVKILDETPIEDWRIDGGQFSYREEEADDTVVVSIFLRNIDLEEPERVKGLTELTADVVRKSMPHLGDRIRDFRFS